MRKQFLSILFMVLILSVSASVMAAQPPKADDQKTLYALGAYIAAAGNISLFNLSAEELKFVQQGFADKVLNKKLTADPEAFQDKINQFAQTRIKAAAEVQKQKSGGFLDKAAKEKGARKLASGLVITTLKEGKGAQPKATDTVKVHYTGTFIDGKVFDSSVKRGEPAEFPLNNVIPCWTEGVGLMKVGEKAKLVCPSNIAYGDMGVLQQSRAVPRSSLKLSCSISRSNPDPLEFSGPFSFTVIAGESEKGPLFYAALPHPNRVTSRTHHQTMSFRA